MKYVSPKDKEMKTKLFTDLFCLDQCNLSRKV